MFLQWFGEVYAISFCLRSTFGFVEQDAASEAHHCRNTNVASNGEPSWKVMSKLLKTARQVIEIAKTTMTILTVAIEGL